MLLLALAAIAERTGGSLLVAGFAAGIVLRRFREPHRLALQLSGLASGFFVPAFFVLLGATLDPRQLAAAPAAIALAVAHSLAPAVAAALVAGGCLTLIPASVGATLLAAPRDGGGPRRGAQ